MTRFAVFDTKPYDRQTIGPLAEQAGVDIAFHEFRLDEETVPLVRDVDGVCVFVNDHLTADVIAALADSGVRLISLRCAGFNNVDLAAAQANGIRVVRVPAYSPYAVAEHAVALLMALNRKVAKAHNRVHELNFSLHGLVGFDIHGKTIGIIGTGKIGKVAAQILSGFGTTVLLYDPFPDERWAKKNGFTYLSLKELAERSDIISLHTPLTPETLHLVGPQFLRTVKRGVYGGAVGYWGWNDEADLAIAIRTAIVKNGELHVQAAGGVVADSVPELEWKETMNKCRALFRAVQEAVGGL